MIVEGPVTAIIAGFLSSLGFLNVLMVYCLAVLGDLIGDSFYYAVGRWGMKFIGSWRRYIGMTPARVAHLERHFKRHSRKTLIFGKLAHGVGAVILMTAGVAKMPYSRFIGFNFLATLPKSLILLLIGYYFGQAYAKMSRYLDYTALATMALAVLFTAAYFIMRRISKKYEVNGAD